MKIHIVKKGDTLYELSKKYGVPLTKIVDANPQLVDPNKLDIGMKIKVPTEPVAVPDGTQPIIHKHAVKQGDSLWKLSKAWGVSLKEIIDANPQLKNPNALLVGEVVNIPSAGTFTNTGNVQNSGGTGSTGDKTVHGSKTYTGPKEEMTAPKPTLPEIPKAPVLPEVEENVMPEVNVVPEITVIPEIFVKPEITIMPELVVMPEMPKMVEKPYQPPEEPIYEPMPKAMEPVCPEMYIAPAPDPCPPFPEYPVHSMPQPFDCISPDFMFPAAPQHMFPEAPCGCQENINVQPAQGWYMPENQNNYSHHAMHAGQYEPQKDWNAPSSNYPGITQQPMVMENSQISVMEPYVSGMQSFSPYPAQVEQQMTYNSYGYETVMGVGTMPEKAPCGCHGGVEMPKPYEQGMAVNPSWSQSYPHHHPHHHSHHGGYGHYPVMPCCGGLQQPYPWPHQGMEGIAQTMGSSAFPHGGMGYPYPWQEGAGENMKKDCGCHGRQHEQESSINNLNGVSALENDVSINSSFTPEKNSQDEFVKELKAEAKVSREEQTRVKSKSASLKKARRQTSKPKRKNPWIKG